MWSVLLLAPPALAARGLDSAFEGATHVFAATVEAVDFVATPEGEIGTRFGLRVGEQFSGDIYSRYVVVRSANGPSPDHRSYLVYADELDFAFGEELLVFASAAPSGSPNVRPGTLILSRMPDGRGRMTAQRVETSGGRTPLGAACSETGALDFAVQDMLEPPPLPDPPCDWVALLQWLRLRPDPGPTVVIPGDAPLSPGAEPLAGIAQEPLYERLARTGIFDSKNPLSTPASPAPAAPFGRKKNKERH